MKNNLHWDVENITITCFTNCFAHEMPHCNLPFLGHRCFCAGHEFLKDVLENKIKLFEPHTQKLRKVCYLQFQTTMQSTASAAVWLPDFEVLMKEASPWRWKVIVIRCHFGSQTMKKYVIQSQLNLWFFSLPTTNAKVIKKQDKENVLSAWDKNRPWTADEGRK